jgi:RHS repeat-associated protein
MMCVARKAWMQPLHLKDEECGDFISAYELSVSRMFKSRLGECIAKVVTVPSAVNQRFVYNEAGQLVGEYGTDAYGSSTTNRDHIWLGTLPIAVLNKGDNASVINYITADGLDTPRVLTSSTGTVIWSWSIKGNPFGDKMPAALSGYAYHLRFAGQYYDAESGLYYNVRRYYAPGSGRYRQVDPIGFAGGQWSLHAYVDSNPLSYIDPLGLSVYGTYDRSTGTLTLHDQEKGTTISGPFESGGKPFGDPIPNGAYDILARGGRDGFYRLEPIDSTYGDDMDDKTGRTHFRVHRPGRTLGCIAAKDDKNWTDVENFINSTQTDNVTVPSMSRRPWAPRTETLPRYGRIEVIN